MKLLPQIEERIYYFLKQGIEFDTIHMNKEMKNKLIGELKEIFAWHPEAMNLSDIYSFSACGITLFISEDNNTKQPYFAQNIQIREITGEQLNEPKIGFWDLKIDAVYGVKGITQYVNEIGGNKKEIPKSCPEINHIQAVINNAINKLEKVFDYENMRISSIELNKILADLKETSIGLESDLEKVRQINSALRGRIQQLEEQICLKP